jgi:hypothetical protein
MTASLFVTGTPIPASGRGDRTGDRTGDGPGSVAHAVARPAVDGLDSSVCGVLVTATTTRDWASAPDADRCPECARITLLRS